MSSLQLQAEQSISAVELPADVRRVLVVIPTLNEAAHIESVLLGLLADLPDHAAFRVLVVDGGSHDGTPELVASIAARHPEVHLVPNPARIQSAAINLAARRFGPQADTLIRCDAHAIYPADFCGRLLDTLDRTGADAVVVPLDSGGLTPFQRAVAWASDSPIGSGGSAHRGGHRSGYVDHGHHAAFRMEILRQIGGYDESFTHNEDAELDCRQRAFGAQIYLDGGIRVGYRPRSGIRALWQQYFRYGAGRSRTVRRHPSSLRLRQFAVPAHLIVAVVSLVLSIWHWQFLGWPALYMSVLMLASLSSALRYRAFCGLLVGVAAFVMHQAWASGFLWTMVRRREHVWRRAATVPLWPEALAEQTRGLHL